MNISSELETK